MNDIIKKIGFANDKSLNMINKVTIPIVTNEFEETNPYIEEQDMFNQIEDITSMYRTKNIIKPECEISGIDTLILCILEMLDPTVSLLSNKIEKIENFKRIILLKYEKCDINTISTFLKKTVVVKVDNIYEITGSYDEFILIEKKNDKLYIHIDACNMTLDDIHKHNTSIMMKKYINDGIIDKLDKMIVKELKDLAEKLNVNTFKIENNKKKQLLKNEIKDVLKTKFDNYIYI